MYDTSGLHCTEWRCGLPSPAFRTSADDPWLDSYWLLFPVVACRRSSLGLRRKVLDIAGFGRDVEVSVECSRQQARERGKLTPVAGIAFTP